MIILINFLFIKTYKAYTLVKHMDKLKYYFSIKLKHLDCWSNHTPFSYSDFLLSEQNGLGILKAKRLAIITDNEPKKVIKNVLSKDDSIIDYEIDNLSDSNRMKIFSIEMVQKEERTVLSKLMNSDINLLSSKILGGIETYEFISSKETANNIRNSFASDNVKIISLSYMKINNEIIMKLLSRGVTDVMLTEKQKSIIKRAKDLGYFNVPRNIDLEDLAEEFGISKMGASLLIRNTIKKLLDIL